MRKGKFRLAAIGAGALAMVTATSAVMAERIIPDVQTRVTTATTSRQGPGPRYPVFQRLPRGTEVSVNGAVGNWCEINSAEGEYVQCSTLAPPRGGWIVGKTVKRACWPNCGD